MSEGAMRMIDLLSLSLPRIFGALLVSIGLVIAGGGLFLVWLGGSPYYAIFGALLIVSGFLAAMKRHGGALVYCAALLLTVTWSISEVGLHSWRQSRPVRQARRPHGVQARLGGRL
jgi:glucose dehydrogenase